MNFISMHHTEPELCFREAFLKGRDDDGSIFVPDELPALDAEELKAWGHEPLRELAAHLLTRLVGDMDEASASALIREAFPEDYFAEELMAARALNPYKKDQLICFLDRGPSGKRQDYFLALDHSLRQFYGQTERRLYITAPNDASILSLAADPSQEKSLSLFLTDAHYDDRSIEELERLLPQEGTLGIRLLSETGGETPAWWSIPENAGLSQAIRDMGLAPVYLDGSSPLEIMSAILLLSMALSRLLADELIHHDEPVLFAAPSYAMEYVLAALYLKGAGLPIGRILVCDSRNKLFSDFLRSGRFNLKRKSFKTYFQNDDLTFSPALQMLIFELSGRNRELLSSWRRDLSEAGSFSVEAAIAESWREHLTGIFADDRSIEKEAKRLYNETDHLLDPGAVACFASLDRVSPQDLRFGSLVFCGDHPLCHADYASAVLFDSKEGKLSPATPLTERLSEEAGIPVPCGMQKTASENHDHRLFQDATPETFGQILLQLLRQQL